MDDERFEPVLFRGVPGDTGSLDGFHFPHPRGLESREIALPEIGVGIANASVEALDQFGRAFAGMDVEALILVGDRWETLLAGYMAVSCGIPLVHLHGGEESEGALDNLYRHSLTKLAHLHLVSLPLHARRVEAMGEPPETVRVVGFPGADIRFRTDLPNRSQLEMELGFELNPPVILVTLHPATLGEDPAAAVRALASALERVEGTVVITQPNNDPGADAIRRHWEDWAPTRPGTLLAESLGERRYWGLLKLCDLVAGNSSSGLLEAPLAGVPSLNVGDRQRGREAPPSVSHVRAEWMEIYQGIDTILRGSYRTPLSEPWLSLGKHPASDRIVDALVTWTRPSTVAKRFHLQHRGSSDRACQHGEGPP